MRQEASFDISKVCNDIIHSSLSETIDKYNKGATVLLELPAESYFIANSASVRFLTDNGFEGVYISFQRPYDNVRGLFDEYDIDHEKVIIVDCASDTGKENFDDINNIISDSLKKLKCKNKFILIDSLSTIALYKQESEIAELTKKLIGINDDNLLILFNVAEDLVKKPYIKDITSQADEVINVLNCVKKYSREIINSGILT